MDYINARSLGHRRTQTPSNKVDSVVSKIVGKNISSTDPRLLSFLAEKKRSLGEDVSLTEVLKNEGVRQDLKSKLQ